MDCWTIGIAVLFVVIGLLYCRAPLWAWSLTFFLSLGELYVLNVLSTLELLFIGVPILLILATLHLKFLRLVILSAPLYSILKSRIPSMSATEKEAIAAGNVWIEADLFQGNLDWKRLLNLPKPTLSAEELAFLNGPVEQLCQMLCHTEHEYLTLDLPQPVWQYLKQERFLGMIIPKAYGGLEFSALAHSTIVQKIASHSIPAAITTMVPNSLGPAELLLEYGTEEQKNTYLPRLARGEEIPCFGLTSSEAGSDAGAIIDKGVICRGIFNNQEVLGMRLTWSKRYITLAPVATLLGLAFKLYDPEHHLGETEDLGITLCLIPTHLKGVEIGRRHMPLYQGFMNGPTSGQDVFVPLEYIIGGTKMIGRGWQMLVECLSVGRGISLPALSSASSKVCYRTTGAYARIRKQFNVAIGHFEGVQEAMAQISGFAYTIEAMRLLTLTALDLGIRPSVVTAISKYHMTEMARVAINHAMDVHGGKGIMLGPNNYLGTYYTSLPISITVEGANILTRNLMIFGQGAIRCHPYIQAEIQAMSETDRRQGVCGFDAVFYKHIRYTASSKVRALVHGWTGGFFAPALRNTPYRAYMKQLSRMSMALAFVADLTLILLGGGLKRRERLSARLGDVLSYLWIGASLIKYAEDFGIEPEDKENTLWGLQFCLVKIQEAFLDFFQNFPSKILGFLLRKMVFPFGRAYVRSRDDLDSRLGESMMRCSTFRERFLAQSFIGKEFADPVGHLEATLDKQLKLEPLLIKIDQAVKRGKIPKKLDFEERIKHALGEKIIQEKEASDLLAFKEWQAKVIAVDVFEPEKMIRK